MKLAPYFLKLEFVFGDARDEPDYGPADFKKLLPVITVYVLLACGIFCRQITQFPIVDLNVANVRWSVLIASFIIGFALLPPVMRWINRGGKELGAIQVITAFSIGFLIDLSSQLITSGLTPFLRSIRW
jgi:prepilin signal peptidase PulO-like enzyme (type II secretory pathway)